MTDVLQDAPLSLGAVVEIVSGPYVGERGLIVDRELSVAAGRGGPVWTYDLWLDGSATEVRVPGEVLIPVC